MSTWIFVWNENDVQTSSIASVFVEKEPCLCRVFIQRGPSYLRSLQIETANTKNMHHTKREHDNVHILMPLLNRVHTTTFTNFQPPARCSAPVFSLFPTPVMSRTFLRKLESQREKKQSRRLQTRLVLSSCMVQSFSGKPENYPTMQMRRHPSCIHPRTAIISVAKLFHSLSPPPMYDSLFLFHSFFLPSPHHWSGLGLLVSLSKCDFQRDMNRNYAMPLKIRKFEIDVSCQHVPTVPIFPNFLLPGFQSSSCKAG